MVDVEQHALRALEQDPASTPLGRVGIAPHGLGEWQDEIGDLGEVIPQAFTVDRRLAEAGAKGVMMRAQAVEQRLQFPKVSDVANADSAAADLVLVGRTDAATGGADLPGAAGVL